TNYVYRFRTYMVISAQCESCGKYFSMHHVFTHATTSYFQKIAHHEADDALLRQIERRRQTKNYGIEKCPACGHYQSWMMGEIQSIIQSKTRGAVTIALWVVALATSCGTLMLTDRLADSLGIPWLAALIILVTVLLLMTLIPTIIVYLLQSEKYTNKAKA